MRFSRYSFLIPVLTLCCYSTFCQTLDGDPEHVVQVALNLNSDAIYSGVMDKQLSRMGDAAAVAITKTLNGKTPTANEIERALRVIHMAFAAPQAIEKQSDRQPRAASFVLEYLSVLAAEPKLKKQIADEIELLQTLSAAQEKRTLPRDGTAHP